MTFVFVYADDHRAWWNGITVEKMFKTFKLFVLSYYKPWIEHFLNYLWSYFQLRIQTSISTAWIHLQQRVGRFLRVLAHSLQPDQWQEETR